jgi:hypothetical protein
MPNKSIKFFSLVMIFALFFPLPIGLNRTHINILVTIFTCLGILLFKFSITKKILIEFILFCAFIIFVTLINFSLGLVTDFSLYQATRELLFAVLAFTIFNWGDKSIIFYRLLDKYLPLLFCLLAIQIPLFFSNPSLVNSALDYSDLDSTANVSRIYIYPFTLVVILIPFVLFSRIKSILLTATGFLIAAASASKQIFIFLIFVIPFIVLRKFKITNLVILVLGLLIVIKVFLITGLDERFMTFRESGDAIRALEMDYALDKIKKLNFLISGIGIGTPYWSGWAEVYDFDIYEKWVINSAYEVHNGYLCILLRVGLIGFIWISSMIYRVSAIFPRKIKCIYLGYILLSLASSVSFFYLDLIYFALIVGLFNYKNNLYVGTLNGKN